MGVVNTHSHFVDRRLAARPFIFINLLITLLLLAIVKPTTSQTLTPHTTAKRYTCSADTANPLTFLSELSGDRGNSITKYILLDRPSPLTEGDGMMCTLSRVNNEFNRIFIPIARSYDGRDWQLNTARYMTDATVTCGTTDTVGPTNEDTSVAEWTSGVYLCQITVPPLSAADDGYYLRTYVQDAPTNKTLAARFLERTTWGATWEEINTLELEIATNGYTKALANWTHNQVSLPPTSHRATFRKYLNPRTVESYQYGIPGPKACENNARFRRFAFTFKDVALSRGGPDRAGGIGFPYTPMKIVTMGNYTIVKFGEQIRTVLENNPLQYVEGESTITLPDEEYTICHAEEVLGLQIGNITYGYQFQVLVGDKCTASFTDRDGIQDNKGDGWLDSENKKVSGLQARTYDQKACKTKCGDTTKVKYITMGNPEVNIPIGFNKTGAGLSWIDLSTVTVPTELKNINVDRTHDSNWLLKKDLDTCNDEAGNPFPDPAGLAAYDLSSTGRGKYNLDKPIFAILPGENKWALHDLRVLFQGNTIEQPLMDGGGNAMQRAARSGDNDDGNPNTDLVTLCSNTQRNIFNEPHCKISYDPEACVGGRGQDLLGVARPVANNIAAYAGEDGGGVVVCGAAGEAEPNPEEDDYVDVNNRILESSRIGYAQQRNVVWAEIILHSPDQLCQKMGWALQKIFATSTDINTDSQNSETNINVLDLYGTSCFKTYKDVITKASFNEEMGAQLTFLGNKAVHTDYHIRGKLNWPDENYARENLQLHSIGLIRLNEDGTPVINRFGRRIANYEQKHIFTAAKIWTGIKPSYRRGNYEELTWAGSSYLDPTGKFDVVNSDWFPKIDLGSGYIGDKYPLCTDLPNKHFLKKKAQYRLLGGDARPIWLDEPSNTHLLSSDEFYRISLDSNSSLYTKLCNPKADPPVPSSTLTQGTGQAMFDPAVGAPYCKGSNIICNSGTLLQGRLTNESNFPNTIDTCADGIDNATSTEENVKQIIVETLKSTNLRGGELVKIKAYVTAYNKNDQVDFYYTNDAADPEWKFVTKVAAKAGDNDPITIPHNPNTIPFESFPEIHFRLPKCTKEEGCQQAVRVVLRSGRAGSRSGDGHHKPTSDCTMSAYDDADDLVFDVLPSQRPQDVCDFQTLVTLDENLECHGRECLVDTLRVVEVFPGTFYEYIQTPCVYFPFYSSEHSAKVFANWDNSITMCADKRAASALSSCCGGYSEQNPSINSKWADVLGEYRLERLTYNGNQARCAAWGRTVCDPERLGPQTGHTGHCYHRQGCADVSGSRNWIKKYTRYQWTTAGCSIKVKVQQDGMIAIIHEPAQTTFRRGTQAYPHVQSHVSSDSTVKFGTVSYFYVQWNKEANSIELEYPSVEENACSGGTIDEEYCTCDTTVEETVVFTSQPSSKDDVLHQLHVGAFDPSVYGNYMLLSEESTDDVSVYATSQAIPYTTGTIFRVVEDYTGNYLYFKNVQSVVHVCSGGTMSFTFRNSPTFFDITNPELSSAYQETEAYIDYVHKHQNTPPFVCKSLLKHFGYSNPTPDHVSQCSEAYKRGVFTYTNPANSDDTLDFGEAGQRGNLAAMAASIVLSNDALSPSTDLDPSAGGPKSPLLKLTQTIRSFKLTRSLHHLRIDGYINAGPSFGEFPYKIPDQFSFYSPHFLPPGAHRESYLMAPEAELQTMNYIIDSQNALYNLFRIGLSVCDGGVGPRWARGTYSECGDRDGYTTKHTAGYLDFTPDGDVFSGPNVVGQLATILTSDRISSDNRARIVAAFDAIINAAVSDPTPHDAQVALQIAQVLMVTTPEFHVTNKVSLNDNERTATPPRASMDNSVPYKAIVHVYLFGGLDSMNMLAPHPDGCPSLYEEYKIQRGDGLYLTSNEMTKIDINESSDDQPDQPCSSFGVNSYISRLADIFDDGIGNKDGLFIANIGHLQKPVNRHNFDAETDAQLFSHFSMREEGFNVDAFNERYNSGILGRMNDVLGNSMATGQIAMKTLQANLVGDPSLGRKVDILGVYGNGVNPFYRVNNGIAGPAESKRTALLPIMRSLNSEANEGSSIHANLWSQSLIDSEHSSTQYASHLNGVSSTSGMSGDLGSQLNQVLRLMKARESRQVNRDAFAIQIRGFDQHFSTKTILGSLLSPLNQPLWLFREELKTMELWDSVTLVITSEFGRTITPNANGGSDHGWGGNYFVAGGKIKGGRILGQHPGTYDLNDQQITGRGAWIPTTANEGMWYGIAQWFGITSPLALNYVLPNTRNFPCRLYSEADLYEGGTGVAAACGGDTVVVEQKFFITEPRLLNPDEQVKFCEEVVNAMGDVEVTCVVLSQLLSTTTRRSRRHLNAEQWELDVEYEVNGDGEVAEQVVENLNSEEFSQAAAGAVDMEEVEVEAAVIITHQPTSSPTTAPSSAPTRPEVCDILTEDIFLAFNPSPSSPYSYSDFCTAVENWNTDNPNEQIFMGGTDMDRRHELAAFFGNILYESGGFVHPREISQCGTTVNTGGTLYCKPSGYQDSDGQNNEYCSAVHTSTSDPDGCDCLAVDNSSGSGYEANKLFFGRGPIQLSWNYNYLDAGNALGVDLCTNPELVANDGAVAWGSAIWFWMTQGATTAHDSIEVDSDFGGTVKAISEGNECPAQSDFENSVVQRLDKYCEAATQLNVDILLDLSGCNGLQSAFDSCLLTGSRENGPCAACNVWEGVTKGPSFSPTQHPSLVPTDTPTSSPTAPTAAPTQRPTQRPIAFLGQDGYEYVGKGNCKDSHQFEVQSYGYVFVGSKTSASECPDVCQSYKDMNGFRGLEFESDASECRCLFDSDTSNPALTVSGTAMGTIVGVINNASTYCYQTSAISTQGPSSSPTPNPTKSPITSNPTKSPITPDPTETVTTKSPVTPNPTQEPSKRPSSSPTNSNEPTSDLRDYQQASAGATENIVTVTAGRSFSITGTYSDEKAAQSDCPTEAELQSQADSHCEGEPNCVATILSSSCGVKTVQRRRELLRTERELQAKYTVTSNAVFSITIRNWCANCDAVAIQAIVDDITATVTANAATISVTCPSGKICSTDIAEITVSAPLINDIVRWYPLWLNNEKNTCANDGNYELYMLKNNFLKSTLEACCAQYYGWTKKECLIKGGKVAAESGKFYVEYEKKHCVQDCLEDGKTKMAAGVCINPGGLVFSWMTLYDTAEACCKDKLFWVPLEECIATSSGGSLTPSTYVGSSGWYMASDGKDCVQDCNENSGPQCVPTKGKWEHKYTTSTACCKAKFDWLMDDRDVCKTARTYTNE